MKNKKNYLAARIGLFLVDRLSFDGNRKVDARTSKREAKKTADDAKNADVSQNFGRHPYGLLFVRSGSWSTMSEKRVSETNGAKENGANKKTKQVSLTKISVSKAFLINQRIFVAKYFGLQSYF